MKKFFSIPFCLALTASSIFCQGITTASDFFKSISERYSEVQDYEADVTITIGKNEMSGRVSYKQPEMLRIDFSDPAEQVVLFNGSDLTIYLPGSSAILEQNVSGNEANAATAEGLSLMRRYYTVAYQSGQDAVPLDDGSDEMVEVELTLNIGSIDTYLVHAHFGCALHVAFVANPYTTPTTEVDVDGK